MRILADIGHPAHVHLFRNMASEMTAGGHEFLFTVREGECQADLLTRYGLEFRVIGRKQGGRLRKLLWIPVFSFRIAKIARKFRPDLFLSHGSMYAGYAAFLTGKRHIALEDTGNMEQIMFSRPVSDIILSPQALKAELGPKHLRYNGFHELAYLHPNRFSPDVSVLSDLGLGEGEQFTIMRFISWGASHDAGHSGLTHDDKKALVETLSSYGKVFISSEKKLPDEFAPYALRLAPHKLHDALFYASLYIGEGATTASECAMLGTPAIYVNTTTAGTLEAQEGYGLVHCIFEYARVLGKAQTLLSDKNTKQLYRKRRDEMLKENIDVTAFLVWFVGSYPLSAEILRDDASVTNKYLNA